MTKNTTHKIVTFGEVMMRLCPPDHRYISQTESVNIFYGGTEANVAIGLANLGCDVTHVTALPNDFTGAAVLGYLKQNDVRTQFITRNEHSLGLYFMEEGAVHKSGRIAYNRLHGAFAHINPKDFDWNEILEGASWFHWTGITPGISLQAYTALKEALKVCNEKNITVSTDPVYRTNLWNYGESAIPILNELVNMSTIFIGGPDEINMLLSTSYNASDFKESACDIMDKYINLKAVINKTRSAKNATWQKIRSMVWTGKELFTSDEVEITHIIDRIGTGDAFAVGLIYGMLHYEWSKTLAIANACCALKHVIPGDASLVTEEQLNNAVTSGLKGRLIR